MGLFDNLFGLQSKDDKALELSKAKAREYNALIEHYRDLAKEIHNGRWQTMSPFERANVSAKNRIGLSNDQRKADQFALALGTSEYFNDPRNNQKETLGGSSKSVDLIQDSKDYFNEAWVRNSAARDTSLGYKHSDLRHKPLFPKLSSNSLIALYDRQKKDIGLNDFSSGKDERSSYLNVTNKVLNNYAIDKNVLDNILSTRNYEDMYDSYGNESDMEFKKLPITMLGVTDPNTSFVRTYITKDLPDNRIGEIAAHEAAHRRIISSGGISDKENMLLRQAFPQLKTNDINEVAATQAEIRWKSGGVHNPSKTYGTKDIPVLKKIIKRMRERKDGYMDKNSMVNVRDLINSLNNVRIADSNIKTTGLFGTT